MVLGPLVKIGGGIIALCKFKKFFFMETQKVLFN